jgi:hypothetical protein
VGDGLVAGGPEVTIDAGIVGVDEAGGDEVDPNRASSRRGAAMNRGSATVTAGDPEVATDSLGTNIAGPDLASSVALPSRVCRDPAGENDLAPRRD